MASIERYVVRETEERNNVASRNKRDQFLREVDGLLSGHTSRRLHVQDDRENWIRYRMLLEELIKGNARFNVALELFVNSFLVRYKTINENREIGFHRAQFEALTRPGHGENAIDFNMSINTEIFVSAPIEFTIPLRLSQLQRDELPVPHRHRASSIPRGGVSLTTDMDEVFFALCHLLRKKTFNQRGQAGAQNRVDDREVDDVISQNYESDLAPDYLLHGSAVRQFDLLGVQMILKGLAFYNLTETRNAEEFDEERQASLRRWEELIVERLGLPTGTVIFNRDLGRATRRRVSVSGLILHRPISDVLKKALEVLESPEQSDPLDREGLVHRIWRLVLWLAHAGASPYNHGQAVRIEHAYESTVNPQDQLIVEVLYSHLFSVDPTMRPGRTLGLGALQGEVGLTGNARNAHVHMEIRLKENGRLIGTILPHEFFPLVG